MYGKNKRLTTPVYVGVMAWKFSGANRNQYKGFRRRWECGRRSNRKCRRSRIISRFSSGTRTMFFLKTPFLPRRIQRVPHIAYRRLNKPFGQMAFANSGCQYGRSKFNIRARRQRSIICARTTRLFYELVIQRNVLHSTPPILPAFPQWKIRFWDFATRQWRTIFKVLFITYSRVYSARRVSAASVIWPVGQHAATSTSVVVYWK